MPRAKTYREWIEIRLRDKLRRDPKAGCWVWIGQVNRDGYGYMTVTIPGRKRKKARVHRLAAWLWLDMDLDDRTQEICHGCDNKRCCRPHPKHVRIGTRSENLREAYARGLQPKRVGWPGGVGERRGQHNPRAKLTVDQVKEIRILSSAWHMTQKEIAESVNISRPQVNKILRGKSWTNVT